MILDIIMCIGYDPIAEAMPYFFAGVGVLLVNLVFIFLSRLKKWKSRNIKKIAILLGITSLIFFIISYSRYLPRFKC